MCRRVRQVSSVQVANSPRAPRGRQFSEAVVMIARGEDPNASRWGGGGRTPSQTPPKRARFSDSRTILLRLVSPAHALVQEGVPRTRAHAHTHTRTHTRAHTRTHTRAHTHTHTRARAHTGTRLRLRALSSTALAKGASAAAMRRALPQGKCIFWKMVGSLQIGHTLPWQLRYLTTQASQPMTWLHPVAIWSHGSEKQSTHSLTARLAS